MSTSDSLFDPNRRSIFGREQDNGSEDQQLSFNDNAVSNRASRNSSRGSNLRSARSLSKQLSSPRASVSSRSASRASTASSVDFEDIPFEKRTEMLLMEANKATAQLNVDLYKLEQKTDAMFLEANKETADIRMEIYQLKVAQERRDQETRVAILELKDLLERLLKAQLQELSATGM